MATYEELRGSTVYDIKDEKIGTLDDFYIDDETSQPTWVTVKTGLFGTKTSFVPLVRAEHTDEGLRVSVTKDQVKDAPRVEPDEAIDEGEEGELYQYYRDILESDDHDSDEDSANTRSVGEDISGPETDGAMTRSEEEVQVDKNLRDTGTVRLKKYVTTENVTFTVPVRKEKARLTREPITDANIDHAMDGPAISDEEHEVTLREEVLDVNKNVVPKERVRLDKDTVDDEREVSEQVRKENIDVEGNENNLNR